MPIADNRGLDSPLHDHFGSSPYFAYADTESDVVEVAGNAGHHHGHGHCDPAAHVSTARVDAVVCHGMGKRAFASLRGAGLDVYVTAAGTVRDAIAEVRAGGLEALSADEACGGHATHHGRAGGR